MSGYAGLRIALPFHHAAPWLGKRFRVLVYGLGFWGFGI